MEKPWESLCVLYKHNKLEWKRWAALVTLLNEMGFNQSISGPGVTEESSQLIRLLARIFGCPTHRTSTSSHTVLLLSPLSHITAPALANSYCSDASNQDIGSDWRPRTRALRNESRSS